MPATAAKKRKRPKGSSKSLSRPKKLQRSNDYQSSSDGDYGELEGIDDYDNVASLSGNGKDVRSESNRHFDSGTQTKLGQKITQSEDSADGSEVGREDDAHTGGSEDEGLQDEVSDEDESDASSASEGVSSTARRVRKRNDPSAFANSISTILNSKLTSSKRQDPVLSRSKDASLASQNLADSRLEAKARKKLREEKKAGLEKGRVKDVLGLQSKEVSAGEVTEKEKSLKRTAQRGVVKLFNAVRAAQVQAEKATQEARGQGIVGEDKRREKVNEMSKKGFLDLLVDG